MRFVLLISLFLISCSEQNQNDMGFFDKLFGKKEEVKNEYEIKRFETIDLPTINKEYQNFLSWVNKKYPVFDAKSFEIGFSGGIQLYNDKSNDLVVSGKADKKEYIVRFTEATTEGNRAYNSNYYRNFVFLIDIFNRYFVENGINQRLVLHNDKEKNYLVISDNENKVSSDFIKMSRREYYGISHSTAEVQEYLTSYKDKGLFSFLDQNTIQTGYKLSKENGISNLQTCFWFFNNLVIPVAPSESSGYKAEFEYLNKGCSAVDFSLISQEIDDNGKVNLELKVADEKLEIAGLPQQFSLLALIELNKVLRKHGGQFYIWNWDRNPWEQIPLVYMKESNYKDLEIRPNGFKEFRELGMDMVEFYDED